MHASISFSPCLHCTRAWPSLWNCTKRDLSLKTQCLQCPRSDILCVRPHIWQHRLWSTVNLEHLAGRLTWKPAARSLFTLLQTDNLLRNRWTISMHRRAAGMKRLSMTIWINSSSPWAMVRLLQLPSLHWCGWPMSQLCRKSSLTNPCNTTF